MGRERAHRIQGAAEVERAAGLQRLRVELPGEPLLAEGEEPAADRVDADVERRFQGDAAHQPVAGKRGAERAVERPAGGLLLGEPGAAHVAGGEAGALRRRSGGRRPCRRRPASAGSAGRRARSGPGRSGSRCRAGRPGPPPRLAVRSADRPAPRRPARARARGLPSSHRIIPPPPSAPPTGAPAARCGNGPCRGRRTARRRSRRSRGRPPPGARPSPRDRTAGRRRRCRG